MTEAERDQYETATRELAASIGVEYFDTRPKIDIKPLVGKLTVAGMEAYGIVPLALDGAKLTLGINESTKRDLLDTLTARLAGYEVSYRLISGIGWSRLINRYAIAQNGDVIESGDFSDFSSRLAGLEPKFMFEPIAQLAFQLGASDIHIEPGENSARIRFRLDGTLHPILELTRERYELFTSDMQIRANVKWGADEPQGGRLAIRAINDDGDEVTLNMRLETVPSLHGQDVVIRIFNLSEQYLTLDNLLLTPPQREVLDRAIAHPRGMVLTVGPTGSGKTSTLYSIINHLNNPEVKIVTLEDPVEYELDGISQVPVVSEDQESFGNKLRAVLREDPNIIMIGEIRDADTAKTALQAALTGHLVLSTFHAASASAAVTRLIDMIGENPLLASSIRLIMAQRLVRQLCPHCRAKVAPTKQQLLEITTALQGVDPSLYPALEHIKLAKSVGCEQCHHFGYSGRISLIEQLSMTPELEAMITQASSATTTQAIEQAAIKSGMMTLLQDGVLKVLEGKTTLEEVYSAVGE
ncbi:type II/IV secretion system protein [Candidatus Saccharibacteria bacterium]|nr:type II/IV secretion system protein [Candidatus Saccharibacteria bacterium]